MKHLYLNLKRFDVPPVYGGVNRLAPGEKWGGTVVERTQEALARYDAARVETVLAKADREENKQAFDKLFAHKEAIESALGAPLIWDKGEDKNSSKIYRQLSNVSIDHEVDWLQMARFHAEWAKKMYDVLVSLIVAG